MKQLLSNYMIVGPLSFEATNARFKRDTEVIEQIDQSRLASARDLGLA